MSKCQYDSCKKEATRGKVRGVINGDFIYCEEHGELAKVLSII